LIVDSHCHLQDEQFDADRDVVVARAIDAGVGLMVAPAVDATSARKAIALARAGFPLRVAIGIHPNTSDGSWDEVEALAGEPEVVAVGETGLDYYRGRERAAEQRALFARHLELADRLGLPVIVHNREADEDVLAMLEDWQRGSSSRVAVLHCFVGGPALAERALAMGAYLGLGGPLTFKSADAVRETANAAPLDRLLVETDAPYLAPAPHRGKRNEPAYARLVLERLAGLRGEDFRKLEAITHDNAVRVFGLSLSEASRPLARGQV
jgi:TatD DNase family protein